MKAILVAKMFHSLFSTLKLDTVMLFNLDEIT